MLCFLFKSTVRKDKTGPLGRSCSSLPRHSGLNRESGLVGTSVPLLTRSACLLVGLGGHLHVGSHEGRHESRTGVRCSCACSLVPADFTYKILGPKTIEFKFQDGSRRAASQAEARLSLPMLHNRQESPGLACLGAGGGPRAWEVVEMRHQRRHHSPRGAARPPGERGRRGP